MKRGVTAAGQAIKKNVATVKQSLNLALKDAEPDIAQEGIAVEKVKEETTSAPPDAAARNDSEAKSDTGQDLQPKKDSDILSQKRDSGNLSQKRDSGNLSQKRDSDNLAQENKISASADNVLSNPSSHSGGGPERRGSDVEIADLQQNGNIQNNSLSCIPSCIKPCSPSK